MGKCQEVASGDIDDIGPFLQGSKKGSIDDGGRGVIIADSIDDGGRGIIIADAEAARTSFHNDTRSFHDLSSSWVTERLLLHSLNLRLQRFRYLSSFQLLESFSYSFVNLILFEFRLSTAISNIFTRMKTFGGALLRLVALAFFCLGFRRHNLYWMACLTKERYQFD